MNNNVKSVDVKCTAALDGDTPLLVNDNNISTIRQTSIVSSGKSLNVYSLDDKLQIKNSQIIIMPQTVYEKDIYDIGFSNGYHLKCSKHTGFMTKDGNWLNPNHMVKDLSKVLGVEFNPDNGFKNTEYTVTSIEHQDSINQQLYLFISQYGNILVPFVGKDNEYISFIDISQ